MPRANLRYINVEQLILAKSQEREKLERQRAQACQDSMEIVAWLCALGISLTFVVLIAGYQEGWF
jgi:hypothetical protein